MATRDTFPPALPILPLLLWTISSAHAENWPQFRGPSHQGLSAETGLPLELEHDGQHPLAKRNSRRELVLADRLGRPGFRDDRDE